MAATTVAEKIAEIERKQHFTSDWFEESLQEMADFVKYKYDIIEKNNIALVKKCDEYRDEYYKMLKEKGDRINSEPLTVERLTAAGWTCKFNEDTNIYACSIDTPHLILYVGLGKDYTHFFTISKFKLKKGERVEMLTPQKIDVELFKTLKVGEFNSLLEIYGLEKYKINTDPKDKALFRYAQIKINH